MTLEPLPGLKDVVPDPFPEDWEPIPPTNKGVPATEEWKEWKSNQMKEFHRVNGKNDAMLAGCSKGGKANLGKKRGPYKGNKEYHRSTKYK